MARKRGVKTVDLFAYAEDNRPSIVYMARNTKNGNLYIGVTRRSVEQRRKKHLGEAARGTPSSGTATNLTGLPISRPSASSITTPAQIDTASWPANT